MGRTPRHEDRLARQSRERQGRTTEWLAAFVLMLKGYRILARREKTPAGEIDLIVRRGRRLAFVEVKARRTMEDALEAITPYQRQRIEAAADLWLARRPRFHDLEIGFDVVLVVPGHWPRHMANEL